MIKTIFFDFDGVLTTDGKGSLTTAMNIQESIPDVSVEKVLQCYRVPHDDVLIGKQHHSEVWDEFCTCVGKTVDISVLYKAFEDIPENEKMLDLSQKLRENHLVGIITDNGKERFEAVTKTLKLDELFDVFILSADIGSTKKTPEIFEKALQAAKCAPHECLFIDNDQHNLIVPMGLGFKIFWHDHEKNDISLLINYLKELGVMI